jgi:chromosome segregation ATPase
VIVGLDEKIKVTESVKVDLQISRDTLQDSEANRVVLQEQLRQFSLQMQDEAAKNHKFQETLISENKRLVAELERARVERLELEKELGQRSVTVQVLTERALQLSSEVTALRAQLARTEDVERQLATANQIVQKLNDTKAKLQKDLETASDYLLE